MGSCIEYSKSKRRDTQKSSTKNMTLTEAQERDLKVVFGKYSKDGKVGSKEIASASRAGGLNPDNEDLKEYQGEAKSGFDLDGFKKFMDKKLEESEDTVDTI